MFVDLMNDIHNTFAERFLRAQLVFEAPPLPPPVDTRDGSAQGVPKRRYNALGILEDVREEEPAGSPEVMDIGPSEPPAREESVVKADPMIVGAGRARKLSEARQQPAGPIDWSTVGRNDACPCGSGRKFKKCHGVNA